MTGILSGISDAVAGTVNAVTGIGKSSEMIAAQRVAEQRIKELTGSEIEVDAEEHGGEWTAWMLKTGINSLCCDDTWSFLEKSSYNERRLENWKKMGLKKIVMCVGDDSELDDDEKWMNCWVERETGKDFCTIYWYPHALTWSSDYMWNDSGYKRWWIISDELVFGLQLYQLAGKCFYKSDWLDNFEDVDPDGLLPSSTKKFRRWFQFRHWCFCWFSEAQWGYNYQWTEKPPKNPDGTEFSLDKLLSFPSMPSLKMPQIKFPSLPGMPSMPSLSMPSMPSLSMPSMSMPSLSMPSMPEKKKRPQGKWDCHGMIEFEGMKVKAKGKTLVLSNCTIINMWLKKDNSIEDERKEHQRLELECTDEEQAVSWVETMKAVGIEEGEVGGCCNVA